MTAEITNLLQNPKGNSSLVDGFEWVDLDEVKPTEEAIALIEGDFALNHQLLPLFVTGGPWWWPWGAPLP